MFRKPDFEWTKEEEFEIWEKFKKKKDLKARDLIFKKYLPFVDYVAIRMKATLPPTVEFDDLVGYGCLGLYDAVIKFDYTVGAPFNVYAKKRIHGAILDELRKMDLVPRSVREKFQKIEQLKKEYLEKYERKITDEEISKLMEIKLSEVKRISQLPNNSNISSIDRKITNKEGGVVNLSELIPSPKEILPEKILQKKQLQNFISNEILQLPQIQKEVLILRYAKNHYTLKEAAKVLEITESRVCQIEKEAINMIRTKIQKNKKDFL